MNDAWLHSLLLAFCPENIAQSQYVVIMIPNLDQFVKIIYGYIWLFPEIGVPPVIIHLNGTFHYKPTIVGIPHLWKPRYETTDQIFLQSKDASRTTHVTGKVMESHHC